MAEDIYGQIPGINTQYTARDAYNDEIMGIKVALSRGEMPYGSVQDAFNAIRDNYAIPAGVSMQELTGTVYGAYGLTPPPTQELPPTQLPPANNTGTSAQDLAYARTQAEERLKQAVEDHKTAKAKLENDFNTADYAYKQASDQLRQSESNLATQRDQGLENTSAYFSNVSPDAFQSQMGNYNNKVLDAFTQGQNTIASDRSSIESAKVNAQSQFGAGQNYYNTFSDSASKDQFGNNQGGYTGSYNAPIYQQAQVTAFDQGISKLGAGQVPQWAPNYGGLSTMQAKKDPNEPYSYMRA